MEEPLLIPLLLPYKYLMEYIFKVRNNAYFTFTALQDGVARYGFAIVCSYSDWYNA